MNQRAKRRLKLERDRKAAYQLAMVWSQCENVTYYPGIDYRGWSKHINQSGEFHYGVISMHEVTQAWCDSSEGYYGNPHCPKCGNEAVAGDSDIVPLCAMAGLKPALIEESREDLGYEVMHHACGDYACDDCRILFDAEDAFGDEPISHHVDDGEYKAEQSSNDSDILITQSPYFTYAQFCSPCAPGAGHLENPCPPWYGGVKTFAFGHDWFEDNKAPYPVWSVKTGKLVLPK